MALVFYFISVSLILVKVIYGEDNSCDVFKNGTCIHTIDVRFSSDLKTVTVLQEDLSGKTETIAVCDWVGFFSCITKTGITSNVVSRTEIHFSPESVTQCLNGKFTLGATGHGTFPCVEKSDKSELKNFESESNTDNDERTPTHNPPQTDDRESSSLLTIAISISVIISVAITAVVIMVIVRRKRMAFKRQNPTQSQESLMKKPEQPQV
ncbi:uncharacterized protein LOC112568560 [Pomacea canaliculata]|uniref:uncharacterized protein LOC112568560 n=1 Tax=Pomacea canaliculata TaxID=400727 RepID=UPI000D7326DF|nr:uncharacterized protein LOC112568560 [Pomacea canaliculata]